MTTDDEMFESELDGDVNGVDRKSSGANNEVQQQSSLNNV